MSPELPPDFDQRFLVLQTWGFLVAFVWGFSAKWLPVFLGLPSIHGRVLLSGVGLNSAGVLAALAGWVVAAAEISGFGDDERTNHRHKASQPAKFGPGGLRASHADGVQGRSGPLDFFCQYEAELRRGSPLCARGRGNSTGVVCRSSSKGQSLYGARTHLLRSH